MTSPASILARAAELAAAGERFVLATVVAVQRPTSARPGARGIIHPDRTIEGWVGGSCAQPIVIREALRSLVDGQPRLLRLSKDAGEDAGSTSRHADGVIDYLMTCHSGGTLEIFVEPQLPAPALWVAGTTPIARALVDLGAAAGFRVSLFDPDAAADGYPSASRVVERGDLDAFDPDLAPYIVVATQGQWDEEAVERALRRASAYVGLVTSPTRAAVMRGYLREQGIGETALGALRAPAGLDIGAETPEEIALSIVAELIAVRRGRAGFASGVAPEQVVSSEATPAPTDAASPTADIVLLDPVCHMTVEIEDVRYTAEHEGVVYAFCSLTCRNRFQKDAISFLGTGPIAG